MLVKIHRHEINITNLDKVFWPKEKILKGDLIKYYLKISEYVLPHLTNRPFVLKRYPNGIKGDFFYQKQCPNHAPHWIETIQAEDKQMVVCNNIDTLIWLINLGCIELHHWLSKTSSLDKPDILVFDLDPEPPADFRDSLKAALIINDLFAKMNIKTFAKTSGSEGLHIYIPVRPVHSFEIIKNTLKIVSNYLVSQHPSLLTVELSKVKRRGRVYLDYLQNGYGRTMAGAYSVRPIAGAMVSTPLSWNEVKNGVDMMNFTIFNMEDRLLRKGDIFSQVNTLEQDFSPVVNSLIPALSRN
ncbi:MAG: non-homologous end-joining DNA ligase [Bacillota bacterium]